MSDDRNYIGSSDDDTLAAEYVLGVLSAAERAEAKRRIARERGFAALVEAWQARLIPWTDEIVPVQPPVDLWNRISAALPAERAAGGLWSSLMLWRWLTAGAGALALASLVALFVAVNQPAPKPLIATIENSNARIFVATVDPARDTIAVVPATYTADPSRVPELWLIAPGDKPRSLGLLRPDQATTISVPASLRGLATGQAVLAVSLEPQGGSTTGAPTGPVIGQGKLSSL